MATVGGSVNGLILRDAGVNSTPLETVNTQGISYNKMAMAALLEEPEVDHPNIMGIDISAATEVYFDAENEVVDDSNPEDKGVIEVEVGVAVEGVEKGVIEGSEGGDSAGEQGSNGSEGVDVLVGPGIEEEDSSEEEEGLEEEEEKEKEEHSEEEEGEEEEGEEEEGEEEEEEEEES